ncbi:C2 domain-containing protein [Lactarius deliciosus]|nr:C2 domain-containing protein [Lactarius deliciosus]
MATSNTTALKLGRTTGPQPYTRIPTFESSRDSFPGETPVVILRVQIFSCHNLGAKDRNGYSDPFVVVSFLGRQSSTPVCKRSLNPVYEAKDATFDFPIYVNKLSALEFVVWDKDMVKNDFLGKYSLPVYQWVRGTAFAFNDRNNQDFSVDLDSSSHGTMRIKVGLVHPPNSTSLPDLGKTYNALISHGGIVLLEICCAKDLPKWPNMTYTGWDMDPFVEVSIGEEVKRTKVISHSLDPVWDEQLLLHVRGADLSHSSASIQLTVIDRDKITSNDPVGKAEVKITTILQGAEKMKKELNTGLYSVDFPTMVRFECLLTKISKRACTSNPTLTFRASYQSYVTLRKQVEQGE